MSPTRSQYFRLFNRFILRPLAKEKLRTAITVLGISMGVAVMVAVRLANASALESFRVATESMAGDTSISVVGAAGSFDETLLRDIAWLRRFGQVSPVIEGYAFFPPAAGQEHSGAKRGDYLRVLGVDVLRDHPLRRYRLVRLSAGDREPTSRELLLMLADPKAIALTEKFARRRGFKIGDRVGLLIGGKRREVVVRALLLDEGVARAFDGQIALMDISAAQWLLDRLGTLDRLDIKLNRGVALEDAAAGIGASLPPALVVRRPDSGYLEVEKMIAAFHFNLTALAGIALLVGLFLIYNTVSVSVIRRRDEIGILRAIGAGRATVLSLFLGEAVLLALVGAAAGLGVGRLLANAAIEASAATVATFYVASAASRAVVAQPLGLPELAIAIAVALPLAMAAAAVPALEAARVQPVEAMRGAVRLSASLRPPRLQLLVAAVLLIAAYPFSRLEPMRGVPLFGYAAAAALIFGGAFLVPTALWLVCKLAGRVSRSSILIRAELGLAAANLGGAVQRVSISVAALSVALAMMVAMSILISSFRETVVYWVDQGLWADIYVSLDLGDDITPVVKSDPDVEDVYAYRAGELKYEDGPITLGSGDFELFTRLGRLHYKSPADAHELIRRAAGRDSIVVSESFELRFKKKVGDEITLPTTAGSHRFAIVAVYYDYSSSRGTVVMDQRTYERHFGRFVPGGLSVRLRQGASPDAVVERLREACGPDRGLIFTTNAALRTEIMRVFDSSFTITRALEVIAIIVAALGVVSTLITLILERRREIAMLRFIGATSRQVRRMILIEAALIGAVGQTIGVFVGTALSLVIIYVINVQSFAWTLQFHYPVLFLAQATLLILAASVLAGLYPAARGAGADPIRYSREE
jgi:putative ABC transport system permease protein